MPLEKPLDRAAIARRIAEVALLRGELTLSGRKSDCDLDKYPFNTQADILATLSRMFAEGLPAGTTRLAAAELGGIPLVTATCVARGLTSGRHSRVDTISHNCPARAAGRQC